jgi:hypothetical protein
MMKPLPEGLITRKRGLLASASDNASGAGAGGGANFRPNAPLPKRCEEQLDALVPRSPSSSCAHGVSGDSNFVKLLTNPNLKGYRTILATNLLLSRRI